MKTMVTIFAEEGMVLTDGEIFGTTISLAEGRSADDFREITKEEYDKLQEEEAAASMM